MSQVSRGDMYKQGLVVKRNYEKALKWCTKAANNGHSGAQYNIGLLYEHGDGCVQSNFTAFQWFLKSAQQEYPAAQYVVADCKHVPSDDSKALIWNLKAATQGDRKAQILVAKAYEMGHGACKSDFLALKWYLKAANQGDRDAQRKAAVFHRKYHGDPQDDEQAKKWHDVVTEQDKGDKAAQERVDFLKDIYNNAPPATSYSNDNSSKDGYGFSSTDAYYPPQPPQSPYSYRSQLVYPPLAQLISQPVLVPMQGQSGTVPVAVPKNPDGTPAPLAPRRIAAVPNTILDVVVSGELTTVGDISSHKRAVQEYSHGTPQQEPTRPPRNPNGGDEADAMQNYNTMDVPFKRRPVPRNPALGLELPMGNYLDIERPDMVFDFRTITCVPQEGIKCNLIGTGFSLPRSNTSMVIKADHDDVEAEVALGTLYRGGRRVHQDLENAMPRYIKPAGQGTAQA
ncbi:hypothetical protein BG015_001873 [Linnemannia schmuckeri]|uniref:HCP-like protein n=1 Tax=Linnemannia schmuckeri TaxID=64567 RepID=A0A9P5RP82_9FUNG|nr:hypothetical protein BG015_001873 [Linnemannia schmuckeri]